MISELLRQMKLKSAELYEIDFGYPLGENAIKDPIRPNGFPSSFSSTNGSQWLKEFYFECDGLSFPDVHVGYFWTLLNE